MTQIGIIGLILMVANLAVSYKGFKDPLFFNRYKFEVEAILQFKDYKRLLTSGFLHVSWMHLLFNMLSLYFFSSLIEQSLGPVRFLIIYFGSLLGGDLLALFVHRHHGDYSSVGASGAVCGIIFASIAVFPDLGLSLFGLPISIPGWLYGLLFVLYSIYGIRSAKDNVGHEAHLGGALVGIILAVIMEPSALKNNYTPILIIVVPTLLFIYLIIKKPGAVMVDNHYYNTHKVYFDIDDRYNEEKVNRQQEIDRILDKIGRKGIDSLTPKEKQALDDYSRRN